MAAAPLLVLFVSGWGGQSSLAVNAFSRAAVPFLGDLVSSYPTVLMQAPAGLTLAATYSAFGSIAAAQRVVLASLLAEHGWQDTRIADPDRQAALFEAFDGGIPTQAKTRHDIYVPFPPGKALPESYATGLTLLQRQVSSQITAGSGRVVCASFCGPWTASLYRQPGFLLQTIQQTSQAVLSLTEQALEEGYRVLVCADTSYLAGAVDQDDPVGPRLPVILAHPNVEGLRGSAADVSQERELPVRPAGGINQFAPTVAALLGLALPGGSPAPLFADLVSRTI